MINNINVGILTDKPPVFNGGFSQRIKREVGLIKKNGYQVYMLSFCSKSAKKQIDGNVLIKMNSMFEGIVCSTSFLLSSKFNICNLYDRYYVAKVVNWIKKNKIKILVCENLWCAYIGSVACKKCGIKSIFDYHGVVPEEAVFDGYCKEGDRLYNYHKKIEQYSLLNSNWIICVSKKFKQYIVTTFGVDENKVFVVPCCVDYKKNVFNNESRNLIRNSLGIQNKKVLIYAGSITKYQCVKEMIKLFSELKKAHNDYFFLFLSSYNNYSSIEKEMTSCGLTNNDFYIKSVPQEQVYDYYCASDFGLIIRDDHLLNKVASPTKIAEYLSAGLPIIGTDNIGDITDIVADTILFRYSDLKNNIDDIVRRIDEADVSWESRIMNFKKGNNYITSTLLWDSYSNLYYKLIGGEVNEKHL